MKLIFRIVLTLLSFLSLASLQARAQQVDALIDELVTNGTLTNEQGDRIRTKLAKDYGETAAGKLAISDSVQKLQIYGDGRLRFENIDQHNHYQGIVLTDRERYRLRVGADYTFSDNFKAGFELESATADDTANQTFGATFTKASINVGKVYLRYDPTDWLTAYAGKFSNPWYTTTDIVYSYDLNPEGGAEIATFHPNDSLTVGLTAVQYLYINSNEGLSTPFTNQNDVQIIGEQIPVTWKITPDLTFKIAPGFTFYTGGGNTNYDGGVPTNTTVSGTTATVVPGTGNSAVDPVFVSPREANHLAIFSAPGEFNFKIGSIPVRPYWDFELNTQGKERIQDVYLDGNASAPTIGTVSSVAAQNRALNDNIAWSVGLQVGQNKKKGDWSGLAEFRQIGLGAVDQNINGTDYSDSYANQEGLKFAAAYNFTDFLLGTVTFYDTWDYKPDLYASLGGGAAAPAAGKTQYLVSEKGLQRVQVDLGWKF